MDGKVIVVTGASGALGKVVVERAIARGARVAAVDHARGTAAPRTDRTGSKSAASILSDAAQAGKAIDAVGGAFRRAGCADQCRRRLCLRNRRRWRIPRRTKSELGEDASAQSADGAQCFAIGDPASGQIQRRADREHRCDRRAARRRRHGPLCRVQGRRASPHRSARRRTQGQGDRQRRAAIDHRYPGQSGQHAGRRLSQMGDSGRTG